MADDKKSSDKEQQQKDPTFTSLEDAKKALEVEKKLTPGTEEEKEKKAAEDAEKWRNEG